MNFQQWQENGLGSKGGNGWKTKVFLFFVQEKKDFTVLCNMACH